MICVKIREYAKSRQTTLPAPVVLFLFLGRVFGPGGVVVMPVMVFAVVMVFTVVVAVVAALVMLALALGDDAGTQVFPAPVAVRGGQITMAGAAGAGVRGGICILSHGILL